MNSTRALTTLSLLLSTYLSIALVHLGFDKFRYVLAGGQKFATFPDFASQFAIGGSYLFLSIIYLIWLVGLLRSPALHLTWQFHDILRRTALFWTLAFISYPLGNDVYLYLHSGLMNWSLVNPFLVRAASFTSQLSPYVDWGQTSTYGPVSQLLFTISAAFVQIHPIVGVYVFKFFCLALHLLNGYWIWKWLPIQERSKIAIAYLLHPLLLVEQVGSAHVDILVSTSMILFAIGYAKQRFWLTLSALWIGFLGKTIPIIWAPLIAVGLLRQGRWKTLLKLMVASGAIALVLWFTWMPGIDAWMSLLNPGVAGQFQSSIHAIVRFFLDLVIIFSPQDLTRSQQLEILEWFSRVMIAGFLGFYGWRLWQRDRRWESTPQTFLEEMGWITLALMLFATGWLMPWYGSIMITFAALVPQARLLGLTSLAFGLSSSAQYLFAGNSSLKSLISIGLPVLTLIVGAWLLQSQSSESQPETLDDSSPKIAQLEIDLSTNDAVNQ